MMNVYPDYYGDFVCLADKCRHSCCMGWEIDIDDKSLRRFAAQDGEIGEKLRKSIGTDGGAHFILDGDERCPFLQDDGLCELILACGEDMLCDICRDHPRFRSFLPDRTEIGLGLCCESAAELILCRKEPFALICEGTESEDAVTDALIYLRDELLCTAQNGALSLNDREREILRLCSCDAELFFRELIIPDWAEFFIALERMDEEWTDVLGRMKKPAEVCLPEGKEYENLLCYFLYRHFFDDADISAKAAFAVLATELIRHAVSCGGELINTARLFSAETEYSQENMDALYDELETRFAI